MFRLLIVDDEPMILEGLKAYAQRLWPGQTEWILAAASGDAAWRLIEAGNVPDILITDIRMPHGDGIELLRRIRNGELSVRVIVLSGYNDFEYVRDMALLGIENYLLKPVNEQELVSTVNSTLQKIAKEREFKLKEQLNDSLIRENIINRWMYGAISEGELVERAEFLELDLEAEGYCPCCLRLLGTEEERSSEILESVYEICKRLLSSEKTCYFSRNYNGDIIAVFCGGEAEMEKTAELLNACLDEIWEKTGQKGYVLMGDPVEDYWNVAESFRNAIRNGVHIDRVEVRQDKAEADMSNTSPFSLRLAQYVLEHYQEDLSLKSLAAYFRGNAAYIGQVFKRDMDKSFSEYLKDVRLEKAKEFLIRSDLSAKEIAQRVGFANVTYFSTVFKRETGLSPDRYRKEFSKKQ